MTLGRGHEHSIAKGKKPHSPAAVQTLHLDFTYLCT